MIVFRSEVGPDVMMFDEVGQRMMELMGKDKTSMGVVTVEQLPDVIAKLRAAIAKEKALHRNVERPDSDDENAEAPPVGLVQRIVPLIELLEISLARKVPVLWGV